MRTNDILVIAFDADDTLWDCQSHFENVERDYCRLLAEYGDSDDISSRTVQKLKLPIWNYWGMAPRPSHCHS